MVAFAQREMKVTKGVAIFYLAIYREYAIIKVKKACLFAFFKQLAGNVRRTVAYEGKNV